MDFLFRILLSPPLSTNARHSQEWVCCSAMLHHQYSMLVEDIECRIRDLDERVLRAKRDKLLLPIVSRPDRPQWSDKLQRTIQSFCQSHRRTKASQSYEQIRATGNKRKGHQMLIPVLSLRESLLLIILHVSYKAENPYSLALIFDLANTYASQSTVFLPAWNCPIPNAASSLATIISLNSFRMP